MANLEKLVKAFEALKIFQPGTAAEEQSKKKEVVVSKKEKITNCNAIADCICAPALRNVVDFPKFLGIAMETFLALCDDPESDVRMVADECLNRTIKTLLETNLGRLQVELYKEIKKNGVSKTLRAALWRFADMCHLIRPQKCRPYVVNLLPCLGRICRRPEEAIQETLLTSMAKICPVLMPFTNDGEVKMLLRSFQPNIQSPTATCRRTAAHSLTLICQYSRKPLPFFGWLLNSLMDMVIPINDDREVYTLLGVFLTLRHMIPMLTNRKTTEESLLGSFGVMTRGEDVTISKEQLVQIYELLLYYTFHKDHNVVTASLETLQQLLRHAPQELVITLTTKGGIKQTSIYEDDIQNASRPQSCQSERIPSVGDETGLDDEAGEISSNMAEESVDGQPLLSDLEKGDLEGQGRDFPDVVVDEAEDSSDSEAEDESEIFVNSEMEYSNVEIGYVTEEKSEMSQSSSAETLSEVKGSPKKKDTLRIGVSEEHLSQGTSSVTDEGPDMETVESVQALSTGHLPSLRQGDIGSLTDSEEPPVVHCIRLLSSQFLLTGSPQGLVMDRQVRVSVKALALGCVASALTIYPQGFFIKLHKSSPQPGDLQCVQDILHYTNHGDPQLKGTAALLIGGLIQAILTSSKGRFDLWAKEYAEPDKLSIEDLVLYLTTMLEDESSVAVRLALIALRGCLSQIMNSVHSPVGLRIMLALLNLRENPYWLVKVELLELLGEVDFRLISYLEKMCTDLMQGSHHYLGKLDIQQHMLQEVVLSLLTDEDQRVRAAASNCLVKLITRLFYAVDNIQQDPVMARAKELACGHLEPILYEWCLEPQPLLHGLIEPFRTVTAPNCPTVGLSTREASLSRVVALLSSLLNKSLSRHLTFGCLKSLCQLSEQYPVPLYAEAWSCGQPAPVPITPRDMHKGSSGARKVNRSISQGSQSSVTSALSAMGLDDVFSGYGGGILPIILDILMSSHITLDLSAHQDALKLAGNLFTGAAFKCLKNCDETSPEDGPWPVLADRTLVPLADLLLSHIARMLNICSHVLEDQAPGPPSSKPSLPSLPNAPSLSPIKRKAKGVKDEQTPEKGGEGKESKTQQKTPQKGEKEKDSEREKSKKEGLGQFYNLPHYLKLYEVLKGAYSNYKISLDLNVQDKFGSLLKTCLDVLALVLEIAGLNEIGKHTEEMLSYLKSTISQEATSTVLCVQQLLKALFGTNLASQWETGQPSMSSRKPGKASRVASSIRPGLYHSCFTTPYTQLTQCLASASFKATAHADHDDSLPLVAWLKKRAEKRIPAVLKPNSKTDKTSIAAYIRLFEPLVIKALKQYTITSSLDLQCQVLDLLTQLVQLRVNYCLLDSDQIFIGFVIKQFEFIEDGQLRHSEMLIPHIFNFLVLLSYEKYHSKTIIGMPKIIQLCDGIMASGQQPTTHAIPALQSIIFDLFVLRNATKSDSGKDLETQREVVISMLLRLLQYHEVLDMLIVILQQSKRENEDKWKRLSRQIVDMLLPLLAKQQLNVDSAIAVDVVHRLFESVAASVFRPVDILLQLLFAPPADLSTIVGLQRWVSLILITIRVMIAQSKEEVVLSRMEELGLKITVFADTISKHKNRRYSEEEHEQELGVCRTPEETFSWWVKKFIKYFLIKRFLIQVVGMVAVEIASRLTELSTQHEDDVFLYQQMAHLLLYITHMFQSGVYRRVATATMQIAQTQTTEQFYSIAQINQVMRDIGWQLPTLTIQWCNILILLNYDDKSWWSQMLQTTRKYRITSPSRPLSETVEDQAILKQCCNLEIVRRGCLILFCDYVCENVNDAEHMTWAIINHVGDIIELSSEPPVQDFISAIHRNSAASGLLIQAIHSRCENMAKAWQVKKTLHCLEAIHLSQSGALLTLLIDKFLNTNHLAVARFCDMIACRRVEMLLADSVQESKSQLPAEDLDKLLEFMKSMGLTKRHARLASLLNKLRNLISPETRSSAVSENTHPLATTSVKVSDVKVNKELYISILKEQCFSQHSSPRQCARLLCRLDYSSILNVIMDKEFELRILEECVALGVQRSFVRIQQMEDRDISVVTDKIGNSPARDRAVDPLLQASQITLFRHLNNICNMLPVPHQVINFNGTCSATEEQYREKMEEILGDSRWVSSIYHLGAALLQYLVSLPMFPWQPSVPDESVKDVCRFSLLCLELIHWQLMHNILPSSDNLQMAAECFAIVLQRPRLETVIGQRENMSWACTAIRTVHQLLSSLLVLPGDRLVTLANHENQDDIPKASFDDYHHAMIACDQISELVHCQKTHLSAHQVASRIPKFLAIPLRNLVTCLARLPLVNSYARTPPLVWKLGWLPSPLGEMRTSLPPLPLDFLQEKDVLKEYITRVNLIGWTSRQQFEETWMSLLGVVNPVPGPEDGQMSSDEEIERAQSAVLAIQCITSQLIHSMLTPLPGQPGSSVIEHSPRDKPLSFIHTKCGRKLAQVRGLVEREIQALCRLRPDVMTHHVYMSRGRETERLRYFMESNFEKPLGDSVYSYGQVSIESIWGVLGMLDIGKLDLDDPMVNLMPSMDPSGDEKPSNSPQHTIHPPIRQVAASQQEGRQRSSSTSGLDIHSCLQFLLDLYGQFLSPTASPRIPLSQLNATIKSVVSLSDIFTEKQQFEWMLRVLMEVYRTHPVEDDLVSQYLLVGIAKAVAVVGMEVSTLEKVLKLFEACLKSAHMPSKVAALYATLYILETGMSEMTHNLIPMATDLLLKALVPSAQLSITSEQHTLVMWAVAFYIIENYQEDIRDSEFTKKIIQFSISTVSAEETSLTVYVSLMRGLERLLLADALTSTDSEPLVKLAVDRLCLSSPQRALTALGLMLTCMYAGKQADAWTPTNEFPSLQVIQDPESLIVAMERVTVLFDRIRKGFPYEARVITRVLPTFLTDFFPPQDIMNKVIGEFLSSQQPHPQLMAKVVFEVFSILLQKDQHALVKDWVMLSLSNFTQRTPIAMAIWSLTCFFVSASTNHWLRNLLPHIIDRMGKMEIVDRRLFCLAALDFRHQLSDDGQRRSFMATFQAVAQPDSPYADMIACCS